LWTNLGSKKGKALPEETEQRLKVAGILPEDLKKRKKIG